MANVTRVFQSLFVIPSTWGNKYLTLGALVAAVSVDQLQTTNNKHKQNLFVDILTERRLWLYFPKSQKNIDNPLPMKSIFVRIDAPNNNFTSVYCLICWDWWKVDLKNASNWGMNDLHGDDDCDDDYDDRLWWRCSQRMNETNYCSNKQLISNNNNNLLHTFIMSLAYKHFITSPTDVIFHFDVVDSLPKDITIKLFADELCKSLSLDDSVLQRSINSLTSWSRKWRLNLAK